MGASIYSDKEGDEDLESKQIQRLRFRAGELRDTAMRIVTRGTEIRVDLDRGEWSGEIWK